jgi:hypothetical protein
LRVALLTLYQSVFFQIPQTPWSQVRLTRLEQVLILPFR